jgi:hypothetical protein
MNRKIATATIEQNDNFASTKTVAQVQAELAAYKQTGVNPWSTSYNPLRSFQSTKSRAQVTAEYVGARDDVAALTGEDSGSAWLQAGRPARISDTLAGQPARAQ